ncbi:two-component system response regulator [Pedobacter sp. Leaf41]|jgi:DNA-binding LytR/AlgR family response regulator|uniref:LytR/AlgR family response regulator transcription factor n=1 Tax=Pedobacter sp. Leaf41 TaxID=1736218 RepID=UPI000703343F|nr:LytTR family DNA-binding domain-containing protein [Pedobacter sp. Leaf41]KQN36303.1 two-component system response regulator [Pedobacter sp. Leaf41]RZK64268.1 MAG: response regulator transcription factor [Pedobacter sp.]
MKALIVDDNDIARTTLAHLAKKIPNLTIVNEYANAIEAYSHILSQPVDLIFLDIEMPEMTGIELTKNLSGKDVIIIFTSSKKEYALEAFELNIADYLLKPFTPARFLQAVTKAQAIFDSKKESVEYEKDEFLFVRDANITRRLKLDDIFYAEAMGDYVKFYTREKMFAIHGTMKAAEERLLRDNFIRVHRSYIVAVGKIDTLQDGGIIINGKFIPVADAYRKALNTRMNVF